ncbi:MAG: hypothetical protein ACE5EO_11995 [Candidatus Krumholzibacteriia bacterium]
MTRKLSLHMMIAAVLATFVLACGEEENVDPYKTVTLREVTRSTVVSKGFKYKLVQPEIIALNRNLGLIRDGNIIEFIAARSLEDKIKGKTDGYFELNVVKKFSPYVYFKVDQINTETDTVFTNQRGAIAYPLITSEAEYGTDLFEDQAMDAIQFNRTGTLNGLKDKKIKIEDVTIGMEKSEGKNHFFLEGKNARLRIDEQMSDGVGLIFKLLVENGNTFRGGITLIEVEGYADRIKSRIAGTVEIDYVMYGDQLITG